MTGPAPSPPATGDRRLRVALPTTSYPRHAGDVAGNFIETTARALVETGRCEVTVWAPADPAAPAREQASEHLAVRRLRYFAPRSLQRLAYGAGIPWNMRRSTWAKLNVPPFMLAFWWRIARDGGRFDVVHAQWGLVGALAVLGRWLHRRPVVLTVHGSDLRTPNKVIGGITRFAIRRCDAVICNSREFEGWCAAVRQRPGVSLIPLGVGLPPNNLLPPDLADAADRPWPVIVTVGRLIPERRHDLLVRAMVAIVAQHPQASLLLVGDGPERDRLAALVRTERLDDHVRFTGAVSPADVPGFLRAADLYVSPTTIENFGTAVVEAAAHAVPVVTTRVGFPGELVRDGEDGRVVPPADAPALEAALLDMLSDRRRLWESGRRLRRRVESLELDSGSAARQIVRVYEDVLADVARATWT